MDGRDDDESQISTDAALVAALRRHGFTGPRYQRFEKTLDELGRRVLLSWMRRNLIFRRCRDRGISLQAPPRPFTADDRSVLADHTLGKALPDFRQKALCDSGWRADGGATLSTYFVNSLPLHFANPYRAWCAVAAEEESWNRRTVPEDHVVPHAFGVETMDPESIYITRETVRESLRGLDLRTAEALAFAADGYTQAEIGRILGVSRKSVERLISRHHQRISRKEEAGE